MKSLALVAVALGLAIGLGACKPDDACSGVDLGSESCLTVRVEGRLDPGQQLVDALQVDLNTSTTTHRQLITNTADGGRAVGLPIDFRIEFPYTANTDDYGDGVRVVALFGGKPIGYGKQSFGFKRGTHASIEVRLDRTKVSGCFDKVQLDNESDVDCGGQTCPACALGQKCGYSETFNCADAHCGYATSDETGYEICGGQY